MKPKIYKLKQDSVSFGHNFFNAALNKEIHFVKDPCFLLLKLS